MAERYDRTIEYKRHDQEFVELRQSIKFISALSVSAKKQLGTIREYFFEVEALYNINSSYVSDAKNVFDELEKIFVLISDKNYLRNLRTLNPSTEIKVKDYEIRICRRIDKQFRLMCESFVDTELRPKPLKVQKKASEMAVGEEKEYFKALEQMGINVDYD